MNLNKYIPFREAYISFQGKEISVLGIHEFNIQIDRLQAYYGIWTSCHEAQSIVDIDSSVKGCINMTPSSNLQLPAIFNIDGFSIPCIIEKYNYDHLKHAYLIDLSFEVDRNNVTTYIYDKNENTEVVSSRFDILDIETG
jgi:hypothetical protein